MPISDADKESIKQAIQQGRKIEAIKLWRFATGDGLAEAKAAVEAIEAELRAVLPEASPKPVVKTGCAGALVLFLFVVAAALSIAWSA